MTGKTRCTAYLVRWEESDAQTQWRAVVEDAYTGKKFHFTNKSTLLHFLWQALNSKATITGAAGEGVEGQ